MVIFLYIREIFSGEESRPFDYGKTVFDEHATGMAHKLDGVLGGNV